MFSKKTLLACGAGLISLGLLSANVHAQPNLTVGDETVAAGDSVGVAVSFENDGTVVGMNFDINYDDTFVTSIDLGGIDGNDMGPGGVTCNDPMPGVISCAVATFPLAAINSTDVGTIVFTVAGGLADGETSPLTISNTNFSDDGANKVPADTLTDGSLTIAAGDPCSLSITPASHDFGGVVVGNSASQSFTISNGGELDCNNLNVAVSGDAAFSLGATDCGATLAGGASCSADVSFSPGAEGAFAGSLDATADEDSASAPLEGTGTTVPPPPESIPALQPWALALMALVMLMIGVFGVRTFRS